MLVLGLAGKKRGRPVGPSRSLEGFWPMAIRRREKYFQFSNIFIKSYPI
jgi:hypothetical protein